MKKLSLQLVSLVLLSGLTVFCTTSAIGRQALSPNPRATSATLTSASASAMDAPGNLADGTDPVPAPMPLPHVVTLTADGTDPVPAPMPLPRIITLTADGTDPVPAQCRCPASSP